MTLAGFGLRQSRRIRFGYFITILSGCGFPIQYFLISILMKIKIGFILSTTFHLLQDGKFIALQIPLGQITQTKLSIIFSPKFPF